MDEFEKSKLKAELDGSRAGESSKAKLERRRAKKRRGIEDNSKDTDAADEDKFTELLSEAVDGLIDESSDATRSSVISIYDQAPREYVNNSHTRLDKDRDEKEKLIQAEKEHKKELVWV